jgi:hypothetical protein
VSQAGNPSTQEYLPETEEALNPTEYEFDEM